jgi:hypothetical protein
MNGGGHINLVGLVTFSNIRHVGSARGWDNPDRYIYITNKVNVTTPQPYSTLEEYERLFGVDEDAYEQPTTTRLEASWD